MAKVTGGKVLTFSRVAWEKMWGLTLRAKGEISGFGIMDEHDPNKVVDFHIVKQTCSAGSTIMDPDALHELFLNMRDEGIPMDRWRVWWHSHASMKTFFSGTDEDNVERYASDKALWSVVTNHADAKRVAAGGVPSEMYIRVDCFDPDNTGDKSSPQRFTIEKCGWRVGNVQVVPDSWFDEQMKKVTAAVIQKVNPSKWNGNGGLWGSRGNGVQTHLPTASPSRYPSGWDGHDDWGEHGNWWRDDYHEDAKVQPIRGDFGPEEEDLTDDSFFSHPYIEGMYLHGVLSEAEAAEMSDLYETSEVTEAALTKRLDAEWARWSHQYGDMDEKEHFLARNGLEPTHVQEHDRAVPKQGKEVTTHA